MTNVLTTAEYTALQDKHADKQADKSMTNPPRHHPANVPEYLCGCNARADVWDSWGMYCAGCYLEQHKKE